MKSRMRPSRLMALPLVLGSRGMVGAPRRERRTGEEPGCCGQGRHCLLLPRDRPVQTCRTIEAYAKDAIEARYADELKSGLLKWQVVNIDETENEHFIDELGLVSSSLVVVTRNGGKETGHEILQEVWTLVRNKPRFTEYVQRAVGGHLK